MKSNKRDLTSILDDLKLVRSNKLNSHQVEVFMNGILYETIQRKDLFPKNSDLKYFINEQINKTLKVDSFREYLFASRTILAARVQKNILENSDYLGILLIADFIELRIREQQGDIAVSKNKKNDSKTLKSDPLNDWMSYLSERNKR